MCDTANGIDPPEHGGRLRAAARRFGIALESWLDLSTGINPNPYPIPPIPADAWARLPEEQDGLELAAAACYGTNAILPVAGSQAAIQALPAIIPGEKVSLLAPTYSEHPHAWRHRCILECTSDTLEAVALDTDILIIVNPNNPTGETLKPDRLLALHDTLARRGAWLIVDEAFIDTRPNLSLARFAGRDKLVILRSLGKFFGLAGARVGFVLAPLSLRENLARHIGPWAISGPARFIASAALSDTTWQETARRRLADDGCRLAALLTSSGLGRPSGTDLFQWIVTSQAPALYAHLARQGILTRLFLTPASLRFGLPGDENAWLRLADALATVPSQLHTAA